MRSEAELEALLKSISTPDPTLRVRGVVKTPDIEGKLSKDGKVLPGGVKESELPPPLLGEPRVVQSARPAVIPFLVTRAGVQQRGLPIFLDNPALDEEGKRQVYAVLLQIPWLAPEISKAIAEHRLGRSVERSKRLTAKLQKAIYRDDIARYKKAKVKAPYKKLAGLIGKIPFREVTDEMVKALKMRLYRSGRTK
jgi:hypothetical protein